MKKLNYLLLGAAGLLMASCANDDLQAPGSNVEGNYKVKVKLPADMATRAVDMNTGLTANDLYYAVYDAADNGLVLQNKTVFTESAGGALETEVGFNLAPGKSYYISFFAAAPGAATNDPTKSDEYVYTFDAEDANMSVNYGKMTSAGTEENDTYDCFINVLDTKVIGSADMQTSITLYRPIAQINWGTSDLDEPAIKKAYGVDGQYILSNLSTKAYNTWDLISNDVDTEVAMVDVALNEFTQPQSASGLATFPVNPSVYGYVAMQYVLAPRQSETIYDLNLNITNGGTGNPDPTELSADVEVSSAPVQANYQTNIYGTLLTDNVVVNVEKNPNWYTPSYDPSLEYALLHGGTFTLEHDFVLDKSFTVSNNLIIDLNGNNITYAPEGNYDDANEGMFYVTNGASLTIKGEGSISEEDVYTLVWVADGTCTIEGGSYKAPVEAGNLVYVSEGVAYIKGGSYELVGQTLNGKNQYPINCQDQPYKDGIAKIIVTGGSFYNFNPANNPAEGPNTNFVANGYNSIETGNGTELWYTVISENATVASDSASLNSAVSDAKSGDTITVLPGTYTFPDITAFTERGITIDCLGDVIFTGNTNFGYKGAQYGILGATIKGATFSNPGGKPISGYLYANFVDCNFEGANIRDFYLSGPSSFTNCKFSATATYAFHIDSTVLDRTVTQTVNPEVTFTGCEFNGFIAVTLVKALNFNECSFASNGNYGGGNFYVPSYFTNCQFNLSDPWSSREYMYLITPNTDYVFNDCFNKGELITTKSGIFRFYTTGITVTCNGESYTNS